MDLYKHMQRNDISLLERLALLKKELSIPNESRVCVIAHRNGVFKGRTGTHTYIWKAYDAELGRRLRKLLGESIQYDNRVDAHHIEAGGFDNEQLTMTLNCAFTHLVSQNACSPLQVKETGQDLRRLIIEALPAAEPALFAEALPTPVSATVQSILAAARAARVFDGRHVPTALRLFEIDADLMYHADHTRSLRAPAYRQVEMGPDITLSFKSPLALFRLDVKPGAPRAFSYHVVSGIVVNRGPLETNAMRRFEEMLVSSMLYVAQQRSTA